MTSRQHREFIVEWLEAAAAKGELQWLEAVHNFAAQCSYVAGWMQPPEAYDNDDDEDTYVGYTLEEAKTKVRAGGEDDWLARYRNRVLVQCKLRDLEVGQSFTLASESKDRYASHYQKLSISGWVMEGHSGRCIEMDSDVDVIAT